MLLKTGFFSLVLMALSAVGDARRECKQDVGGSIYTITVVANVVVRVATTGPLLDDRTVVNSYRSRRHGDDDAVIVCATQLQRVPAEMYLPRCTFFSCLLQRWGLHRCPHHGLNPRD